MKARWILMAMAATSVGFFTSCEELEMNGMDTMFDTMSATLNSAYYEVEHFIPPAPAGIEIAMDSVMAFDMEALLAAEGYDMSALQSVKLLDGTLEVSEKSRIDNLASVAYFNNAIATESLSPTQIATCESDSTATGSLPMQIEDVELKGYLTGNSYTLTTTGMLSQAIADTLWIKCRVRYQITVAVSAQ